MSLLISICTHYPGFMTLFLVVFLIPLSFFLNILWSYRDDIQCIPFSWFFGHLPFLLKNKGRDLDALFSILEQLYRTYETKNTMLYIPFDGSYIITADPNNIEHVLKTNFLNYIKGPKLNIRHEILLGKGIFNVDGEAWKQQRKDASLLFNVKNFREFMMQVFIDHIQVLYKKLDEAVENESIVDLYDLLLRFTLDAFMRIGMGCHLDSLSLENQQPFAIAFDRAQSIVAGRLTLPHYYWKLVERVNGTDKEVKQCMQLVNTFASTLIKNRKNEPFSENQRDLLSRFLNPSTFSGQHIKYTDDELRDIVLNFIIAGRDTTAQALSWCFFMLCQHPNVIEKLRGEIDAVCRGNEYELNYDTVKSFSYAQAVFKETLRLYPSVPKEIKYAVNDDVWPDGTKIPAGQPVIWLPYAMGRLEHLWGPDALEFRPERWETQAQPSPYKYPVFNAGPRVCLGQQMAILEGVFCLSKLVQKYDFELVNPKEVAYAEALTLQMKNGLRVRVKHRIQAKAKSYTLIHT